MISQVKIDGQDIISEYTYTWDEDLLTKVVDVSKLDSIIDTTTFDFIYNKRQLVKIIQKTIDVDRIEEYRYTWENEKIIKELYYLKNLYQNSEFSSLYIYSYYNEKLSQIKFTANDERYVLITWNGNNLAGIKYEDSNHGEYYRLLYEYGNGKNPLFQRNIGYNLCNAFSPTPAWSFNNITKIIEHYYYYGEFVSDTTIVYNTYDKDGYPTTMSFVAKTELARYTYIYDK